ncbi:NTP transferase domain-containing protein [Sphingobacterium sp. N143]|uniref:nucleotidyltransferase family protein n=1 Tax=Sphingobacterium sp. N143 TaxID=2746727 RepID=UPI002578774C|nr:sugar phosphate nucleotidyltransferase [Sphingobacterium sp. N143]MDM1295921.1 NTP transferase domain-containing protein [Sphingobacterium sp. N143]
MNNTTETHRPILVILAAGMASRYGSAKQVESFGPFGEKIIDYSIYDAIRAGFGKVVFVIREEFLEVMKSNVGDKLPASIEVAYAYQDFDLRKFGVDRIVDRQKPWGTGHAVMSAEHEVDRPFCVINADDFYGADAFQKMADFLKHSANDKEMALVGFEVGNTLSDFGYVSRGVCEVNEKDHLQSVTERTNIYRKDEGIVYAEQETETTLPKQTRVSMNFWGFTPKIFEVARALFPDFVEKNHTNPKAEFFIPDLPDYMVKAGLANFSVLPTDAKWFGVTYKEDKEQVQHCIQQLIKNGHYPSRLWPVKKVVDESIYLDF